METDAQTLLEEMIRRRGYAHEFHKVLATHDPDFLRSYETLLEAAYLQPRRLSRITKELVYVAVAASLGTPREHLRAHMGAAAQEGATSADVLELLELTLPLAGVAKFAEAVAVWREVFDT